jgi:hypothetical protein
MVVAMSSSVLMLWLMLLVVVAYETRTWQVGGNSANAEAT